MAIIIKDQPRQQQQKKESIWETLGRGFASGAGESLGTGLGQLATKGLGNLMDPNQRPLNAQTLEALGLDANQAKAIASIKNPAVQRDIVNATQQRQTAAQEQAQKDSRTQGYLKLAQGMTGQGIAGAEGVGSPITAEDLKDVELSDWKDAFKLGQTERKLDESKKRADNKETKEGHDARRASWELANELDIGRVKMETLDKKGDLDSPEKAKFLEKIGMEQFLTPDSALYKKIRAAYMSGAPKAVGGKVSNFELLSYMERWPSLFISKEGRKLIYEDMKMMNELAKEAYNIEREIVKANGGYRPIDIDYQIDDKMGDIYKKYEQRFIGNIERAKKLVPGNEQEKIKGLPDAAAHKGKKIRGAEGILVSNGSSWIPEGATQTAQAPQPAQASPMGQASPTSKIKNPNRRGVAKYY